MRIEYIIYKDRPYDSMVKLKRIIIIIIIIIIINIIFVRFVVHSFYFLSLSLSFVVSLCVRIHAHIAAFLSSS